jgi:cell division protein FtsI (penicillin-binding protein 3)
VSRVSRKIIIDESTGRRLIEQSRIRLLCIGLFFVLCFASIMVRMVDVAVLSRGAPQTITVSDAESEGDEEVAFGAAPMFQRGDIVDRNGALIATSLRAASMFANPKEIKDPEGAARRLAVVLRMDEHQLVSKLTSEKNFVWIKRNMTPREQSATNGLGIPGLYFLPEERRIYPYGQLMSHVVGYVGIDNKGLSGIEKYYDRRLREGAQTGEALSLSLDVRLQAILKEEIRRSTEAYHAIGGTGIIMDVESGELLAMVSLPDFDPHKPMKYSDAARFNRAALGIYEMGSTFKSFTVAAALEHGVVNMKGGYDATQPFKVATFTIQDTHPKKRWLSVPEIYAFSSNIGTAKMALDIGKKRQKAFLESLGMFKPVEMDLHEKAAPLYPEDWKEINTVTISYGHGISVTPLHLARAMAAMANGGTLPKLSLLEAEPGASFKQERVISAQTSAHMRRLMRLVVDYGTGNKADVPGYRVGGKTGTAEKVSSAGVYNKDAKLASFVGVFPVDAPKYLVLVMVDEPKGNKSTYGYATGGWIAAPVVANIISRMGPLYAMKPEYDVPGDDAEKFWFSQEKSKSPPPTRPTNKTLIHAATY